MALTLGVPGAVSRTAGLDDRDQVLAIAASVVSLDYTPGRVVWTNTKTGHQGWSAIGPAIEGRRCWELSVGVTLPFVADAIYQACRTGTGKWVITVPVKDQVDQISGFEIQPMGSTDLSPCDEVWIRGLVSMRPYDQAVRVCRASSGLTVGPIESSADDDSTTTNQALWIAQVFDTRRKLVGRIYERSRGILEARDHKHRVVGIYDPSTDQTRDARHRIIAYGNVLSHLIMRSADR